MIKTGRILRVFDDEKIAINLGDADGVSRGKPVRIYAAEVEIEDPETSEVLGTYRHLKSVGRITSVSERFSIVGPAPRRERVADPAPLYPFSRSSSMKTVPGEFPVNDISTQPIPSGNNIAVGDEVDVEVEVEAAEVAEA